MSEKITVVALGHRALGTNLTGAENRYEKKQPKLSQIL